MDTLSNVTKDVNWIKQHIILLAMVVLLGFGGIYLTEWIVAKHDASIASIYDARAKAAEQSNTELQQSTQSQIASIVQANATLQSQVTQLLKTVTTRDSSLVVQQAQVQASTPTQLAQQWSILVPAGTVTYDPNTSSISVDSKEAVATVQQLQSVSVLQADNKDLNTTISTQVQEIANGTTALSAEQKAHLSDTNTCTVQLAAKDKDLAAAQANATKSKAKWFGIGFVLGLLVRNL